MADTRFPSVLRVAGSSSPTAANLQVERMIGVSDPYTVALSLVSTNATLNFAIAGMFNLSFAGVPFILLGLAVALNGAYPHWLRWLAAFAGLFSVSAGLVQAFTGEHRRLPRPDHHRTDHLALGAGDGRADGPSSSSLALVGGPTCEPSQARPRGGLEDVRP
jgi:hypothetical protein